MGWVSGIVVYVLIWWVVLFAVLPIGTQPVAEGDAESGWRGAPANPRLWRKVLITTLVSVVFWLGAYALITSDTMSFRSGWWAMPDK